MHNSPVVVKKSGFLSALAYGVFGTLIAAVICGSGLGLYGLNIADRKSSEIIMLGRGLLGSIPEIQESLPPILADLLDDQRDLAYRRELDVSARIVGDEDHARLLIEVANEGSKAVTLMSMRVTLDDENGIPLRDLTTYVATPIAVEDEWRGPLLPDSTRRYSYRLRRTVPADVSIEITELRVWTPPGEQEQDENADA